MLDIKKEDETKYKFEYLGEKYTKDLKSYKVIIVGRYGVGKTRIVHRLMKNNDDDKEYFPTISVDIKNFQVKVNDKIIQIQIWDCCGNDKYAQSMPNLFKNTYIIILVYAINDRNSFEDLKNWYNLVKEHSFDNIVFLIGNKNDLREGKGCIFYNNGNMYDGYFKENHKIKGLGTLYDNFGNIIEDN